MITNRLICDFIQSAHKQPSNQFFNSPELVQKFGRPIAAERRPIIDCPHPALNSIQTEKFKFFFYFHVTSRIGQRWTRTASRRFLGPGRAVRATRVRYLNLLIFRGLGHAVTPRHTHRTQFHFFFFFNFFLNLIIHVSTIKQQSTGIFIIFTV